MIDTVPEGAPVPNTFFPPPTFTHARKDKHGRSMPQTIAHRGFKSRYPENSMAAFRGAVQAGTHALETDVRLSKDNVVVLSHDGDLKRCFGVNQTIVDSSWKYLRELRSTKQPSEPLARLEDLLEYLAQPELGHVWLLLDIKIPHDSEVLMRALAETIHRVPSAKGTRWEDRIILGCWTANFVSLSHTYLPGFPITNIGFSLTYSSIFLGVPNLSYNLLHHCLVSPWGRKLISDAKARNRAIYAWTVNDRATMDWCIRSSLDGVITDDPSMFLDVCDKFDGTKRPATWTWLVIFNLIRINIFAWLFGLSFSLKYGRVVDKKFLQDRR